MVKEEKKELVWRAAEYEYSEKSPLWYLFIGGIGAILIIVAFSQKNFFFAIFILLASITLMFFGRVRPSTISFRLTEAGVGIGPKTFYKYESLDSFTVWDRPNRLDQLILKKKTPINPYIKIPIDSKTAAKARDILKDKLQEFEYQESLLDIISDWLGF